MGIGVPVGIAAAHREWLFKLLRPVLDLMQTLPTFVYLIPALVLFGLGLAPGLICTVVFAIPAPIRLTHLGITSVPKQLIEAGEAFGATKRQLLWKVELPAAWPSIMAGLTQCIMLCLSMVVIAALIGANGLGKPVVRALNTVNIPMGIEAGLAIVVLAIILDRVCRIGDAPGGERDANEREREMSATAVSFQNVDIIFGNRAAEGLALLDKGRTRTEILAAVRRDPRRRRLLARRRRGRDHGADGPFRLRQVDADARRERPQPAGPRQRPRQGRTSEMVDVATCDADVLRRIRMHRVAMVFQQFALLPWRTVAENVGFGLELAGVPEAERRTRVMKQLELVGLAQWAGKYAQELSGGMQQRVGLARAFATEAPILLMDEPFSALDPLIRTKLQDELLELQRQLKRTIIFVSHDLDEALKIGTRIAIMEAGRIIQYGRPQEIVLNPASDYVRDFVAHMNPLNVLRAQEVMHPFAQPAAKPARRRGADRRGADADGLGRGAARRRCHAGRGARGRRPGAAPRLHHGHAAIRRSAP